MSETREDRLLSAINISQQKFEDAVRDELKPIHIQLSRVARDVGVEMYEDEFGCLPVFNQWLGKWESSE